MNELALFAGAGGGILGGLLLGWRTVCAVEIDMHCRRVLMQRQDDGILEPFPIWDDIRTFDGKPWNGCVDIVTGGFPCQAYSTAASGKNVAEDLWPEFRRVVANVAPWLVFAENTSRVAIDFAANDLEEMGYKTAAVSLSAKDLGGDHIRNRYWLLAHSNDESKLCGEVYAEMGKRSFVRCGVWNSKPNESGMANGNAGRMDRYKATGNAQVPAVAATAFIILMKRFTPELRQTEQEHQ